MELGDAARVARHDQVDAAHSDVLGLLGVVARERQRWRRIDEGTHARIEALLERLFTDDSRAGRVCPHARQDAFDRAPRPLVLDAVHGILACWETCYGRTADAGFPGGTVDAHCFDCGRRLDGFAGHDLFIAYGPILVVAALCPACRDRPD